MKWWHFILLVALAFAGVLSLLASANPDGLERVLQNLGFIERGETLFESPFKDYTTPFIENEIISKALAGVVGTLLVLGIMIFLTKVMVRKKDGT